jgi:hypothetical protein
MYDISEKLKSKPLSNYKKRKIRREIREYRSISDIITYLLVHLQKEDLTADDEILHCAFHQLKENHSGFLDNLMFTRGDLFPFSNELQRALFNLQTSGIMEAINPIYEVYRIPKETKEKVRSLLSNRFSDSEKEELSQMSRELESLLSHKSCE